MPATPTVRRFASGEWRLYRELRLRSLADAPDAFGRTLDEESTRPDAEWASRVARGACSPTDLPILAEVDGEPVGLAWGRIEPTAPDVASLYQMWVAPDHRRSGIGRMLLDAVVDWAGAAKARHLALGVTCGSPAAALYERAGFQPAGEPEPLRPGSSLLAQPMRLVLDAPAGSATEASEIVGRQSSHYTRMVRIFAEELGLSIPLTPIFDLMSRDPDAFAGNPALKLPILRVGDETIYGSLNICRVLARRAAGHQRVYWPEEADTALLMNAHEMLAHAMSAQVEVVVHEHVERRAPDDSSRKRRESLVRALEWLDRNLDAILEAMPARDLSVFEVGLFCLVSHLPFRNPLDLSGMPNLTAFERRFGERPSALATPYRFDAPPAG